MLIATIRKRFATWAATWAAMGATAAVLLAPAASHAAYLMTELTIAGATDAAIWDINNGGTMVGWSTSGPAGLGTGFVRASDGTLTTLAGPTGAVSSQALGISDGGIIVGAFASTLVDDGTGTMVAGPSTGFIYSGGSYTSFAVAGANETILRGISPDARYISGYYTTDTIAGIGFVYDLLTGIFQTVSAPNSQLTIAQGINSAGVLAGGDILTGPPTTRPGFLYDIATGTRTDVSLTGATRTSLRSIDDAGVLAGWFVDAGGAQHGFIGSLASFEQIDFAGAVSTFVEGSNNAGWLVGEWVDADGYAHAFYAMRVPVPGSLSLALAGLTALVGPAWLRRRRGRALSAAGGARV
jgi:uncharacterized membrane protein